MKSLFLCGTGRCGTTVTKKALARHPEIFSFPNEALFFDDPHGVLELFNALTDQWHPWRVETALREFENFLLKPRSRFLYALYGRFVGYQSQRGLFSLISPPRYMPLDVRDHHKIVSKHFSTLKEDLSVIKYRGCWRGYPAFHVNPRITFTTIHDKEKVSGALNKFLNNCLDEIMRPQKAVLWLDDSIYVHLQAEDIIKILPEAKFIHMYRDPRDVISSYRTRLWAPFSPVKGAKMYCALMDRWQEVKKNIPTDRYMEVCFEDLMADPPRGFKRMCDFAGLPWDDNILKVNLRKSNTGRWKKDLTKEDLEKIAPYIDDYLEMLSYNGK